MPTWPQSVPAMPLRAGFSAEEVDPLIRFQPTYGEPITRLGSTAVPVRMPYRRNLTTAQKDALMAFWREDCRMGSLEFLRLDPETGGTARFQFTGPIKRSEVGPGIWLCEVPMLRLP